MSKPGRNDLCYCGSGLKYKKCHMQADQEQEKERSLMDRAGNFIRRDLLKFARDERFAEEFAKTLPLYWDGYYDHSNAEQMSQPEALRFFDWFTFDHELPSGKRLIELYAEENMDNLSAQQQKLASDWTGVGAVSLYELTAYEGQTLQLRDYFTGEDFEVFEAGGRGNVELGELIITRLVPVFWANSASASAARTAIQSALRAGCGGLFRAAS